MCIRDRYIIDCLPGTAVGRARYALLLITRYVRTKINIGKIILLISTEYLLALIYTAVLVER